MEEKNTENVTGTEMAGKVFSQEDVNRIISERLGKEREKMKKEQDLAFAEQEKKINEREMRIEAKEVLISHGLPPEALELLNYTNKESCNQSIELLEKVVNMAAAVSVDKLICGKEPLKRASQSGANLSLKSAFGLK